MTFKARLDPEIRSFVDAMTAAWASHPPLMSLPLPEARAVAEVVRARWTEGGPVMARTGELDVPTAHGPLRIRVYDPGLVGPAPALIYLHGGGFTLFSLDTHDRLMREYASAGEFVVIGVDYPLSPERKYPTALNMIVDLVGWFQIHGARIGIDADRIAIGGDSAGGNLSMATCLRLRDGGSPSLLRAMLLNYAGFGGHCSDDAEAAYGGPGSVLDRAEVEFYFGNYLTGPDDLKDPYACPIGAALEGLPPAFLVIPECDILAEQSFAMARRLREAGVDVSSRVYPGATHSFLEAMSIARVARDAIRDGAEWLRDRLAVQ